MLRKRKITLGEMRASGPRRLLVYCGGYRCPHSIVIDAGRLTFGCPTLSRDLFAKVSLHRGADVRPMFELARMGTGSSPC